MDTKASDCREQVPRFEILPKPKVSTSLIEFKFTHRTAGSCEVKKSPQRIVPNSWVRYHFNFYTTY